LAHPVHRLDVVLLVLATARQRRQERHVPVGQAAGDLKTVVLAVHQQQPHADEVAGECDGKPEPRFK
jgi:hypothetical protein